MNCRSCGTELKTIFADLGFSPFSNSFLTQEEMEKPEVFYPLKTMVCHSCFLVQTKDITLKESFFNENYHYYSSYSHTWLAHSKDHAESLTNQFKLDKNSLVVEIASNDGYLLQYFLNLGIPVLGIEPTENTAKIAIEKGIETIVDFFGESFATELAMKGKMADVLIGNNVIAHVPEINDFVKGIKALLKPNGIASFEFPHLYNTIVLHQFDTIYHEHFSYFSLYSIQKIFNQNGLQIFDVKDINTQGGSYRVYVKHDSNENLKKKDTVSTFIKRELEIGIDNLDTYKKYQPQIEKIKNEFLSFLIKCKKENKTVVGYGAAAKGNTFLNFSGARNDLISFIVDLSPYKQNKFTPGMHIPVVSEKELKELKPDYIVIFPWNLKEEITKQLNYVLEWGGKMVTFIPEFWVS